MKQHSSPPQHLPSQRELINRKILASFRWQDAEIAMNVARRCFGTWLQTNPQDDPTTGRMRAYHTHEALHEAARAIGVLIEALRVEARMVVPGPEGDTHVSPAAH